MTEARHRWTGRPLVAAGSSGSGSGSRCSPCRCSSSSAAPQEPGEELGIFLPLAGALVCLGLGAMALLPLRLGDPRAAGSRSPAAIATTFRLLGVLGVLLAAAGLLRSELPWTAFGIAPLLAAAGLLKDSGRVSRLGQRSAS